MASARECVTLRPLTCHLQLPFLATTADCVVALGHAAGAMEHAEWLVREDTETLGASAGQHDMLLAPTIFD